MDAAFAGAKQSLLTATHLAHPTGGAALSVVVDASARHVGACLQQKSPGRKDWQPLGFFSKKLEAAQQKYSAFDRELLACSAGIRHFRYMLDGRRFAIFTDHKPLTYALARVSEPWTARQSRQLSYVAKYRSDIRHIARAANVVADTLYRPPGHAAAERPPSAATCVKAPSVSQVGALQGGKLISSPPPLPGVAASVADVQPVTDVSFHKMAANQASCPSTLQVAKSSSLSVRTVQVEGASLLCDVARGITRPLVPVEDRPAVFHAMHNVAHPGICATRRTFCVEGRGQGRGSHVPGVPAVPEGQGSQATSSSCTGHSRAGTQVLPRACGLGGPLPASSEGHVYLLTIIDRSTRWFEAVPRETWRPARAWIPSYPAGWHVLACRGLSPRTGGHSSPLPCGLLPAPAWASSTCSQQPTIHRVTAWFSACTGSSRRPYVHVGRVLRGTLIFHGCCWAHVPHLRRILQYLQRSWLLGHHWFSLDSSCTCQILHMWTCHRLPRGRCPMRHRPILRRLS
jgi:hypothetical protein